jgi:IS66 C-terminal element
VNAPAIYNLIETAKLNRLDSEAYLHHMLERIADHAVNRMAELLPWNIDIEPLAAPPPEPSNYQARQHYGRERTL